MMRTSLQGLDYYQTRNRRPPVAQADSDCGDTSTIRPRSR